MDVLQPKLIYLTRRNPSLSREQFTARWRQHAKLGISRPRWINIARYVHVDLEAPSPQGERLFTDHDGIGMIWHKSAANRAAHLTDTTSKAQMEEDEAETFSGPIGHTCVVVREVETRLPVQPATWKLFRFAQTAMPSAPPDSALGFVRNLPLPPEADEGWGLDTALVEEFWFETRAEAEEAGLSLEYGALLALGREVQLYP